MAQTIKLKRSATTGNTPTTSQLALGELGINTTDGKLFLKKSVSGTESIVEVGSTASFLPLSGGTLTGNLSLGDNVKAQFGASDDLQIYHDGSDSYIAESNATGNLFIKGTHISLQNSSGQDALNLINGDAYIKSGGQTKLQTTSTGIDVTGSTSVTGSASANTSSMTMGFTAPNGEIKVKNTTGAPASNLDFFTTNSSGTTAIAMRLTPDRDVSISRNLTMNGTLIGASSISCGTISSGAITSTGSVTSTGLTVDGGTASPIINLSRSGTYSGITFSQTVTNVTGAGADLSTYSLNANTGYVWQTTDSGGTFGKALLIAPNRDISFYNDSANQGLFWDSSASSLGIGVTNVGTKLDITTEANKAGLRVTAPNTTNQSFGATIAAGTSASDYALNINNAAGNSTLFKVKGDGSSVFSGSVSTGNMTLSGQEIDVSSGDLTLDVAGNINLDADGANVYFNDGGTERYRFKLDATPEINVTGGTFTLKNNTSDADILFSGNDGGSSITALTLDMSAAGAATFNSSVTSTGLTVSKTASGSTTRIASFVNPVGHANTGVRVWMSGTDTTNRGTFIDAVAESTANNHTLRFGTSASSSLPVERMRIGDTGNVNIFNSLMVGATTAPTDKLEIRGNVKVEQTSNSDAIIRLNPNSGTIGSNYRWELVGRNSAENYNFQIREGATPYLTINNSIGGNAGNATFSGAVTSTGLTVDTGNAGNGINYGFDIRNSASGSGTSYAMPAISWSNGGLRWASVHGERNSAGGYGGLLKFYTMNSSGNATERLKIDNNGDISFYNDSANQGLFWDSSTSRLGLGTTNPQRTLETKGVGVLLANTGGAHEILFGDNAHRYFSLYTPSSPDSMSIRTGTTDLLTINADGSSVFSGSVTAGGHIITNTSSRIENQRISMEADGTLDWGSSKQYGTLTWDTNKAIIVGQQSSSLEFRTNLSGVAMTMDTSQNVNIPNGSLMVGATTAPTHKLEVDGTFRTTGTVTHNGANLDLRADNARLMIEEADGTDITWLGDHTGGGHGALFLYDNGGAATIKLTSDSHANYINNGNNFGIGTTTPAATLHTVANAGTTALLVTGAASNNIASFYTSGGSQAMTLDASSNLLVGKSSSSFTTAGAEVQPSGRIELTRSGELMNLNRLGSDGNLMRFYGSSALVGNIGTVAGRFNIGNDNTGITFKNSTGTIYPANNVGGGRDNAIDLGDSGTRFKDLYLSNNATAQKLTLTKAPVGLFTIEVDGTNTGQPNLIVKQSTNERFRCDNSGNFLIGKSESGLANSGFEVGQSGQINVTQAGAVVARFNRKTSDGSILELTKDGSTVGSIGVNTGDKIYIGTGASGVGFSTLGLLPFNTSTNAFSNGSLDLGNGSFRWKDLHLSGKSQADTYEFAQNSSATNATDAIYRATTATIAFKTGGSEKMRLSGGTLLVGTTSVSTATQGIKLRSDIDAIAAVADGQISGYFGRLNSDGGILNFRKDSTTVGSIGVANGDLNINGDTGIRFQDSSIIPRRAGSDVDATVDIGLASHRWKDLYLSGKIYGSTLGIGDAGIQADQYSNAVKPFRPDITTGTSDNYLDLGTSSVRWVDIYATNGTIQTSDRNEKQDIEDLTEAEERVATAAKGLLKKFRWKSAVEDKGDDARIHFGIIAQDLQAAFEAEGLDAGRYGMFTSNTWTDEEGEEQTRMGVRYSELLAFIISAI